MCGIVGVINGNSTVKARLGQIFSDMLFADRLRGFDGAGVFWYDTRKDHYAVRKDADFAEIWNNKEIDDALRWIEKIPFFIGHNRSATRGGVKSENNHPFDEGDVVLVHNGTMTYLPEEFNKDTQVDSHAIAKMINDGSVEAFIKDSFGAYALAWFNKKTRQLNLIRNKERPLGIVYFKEFALLASEPDMAVWIGKRNGYHPESTIMLEEHKLYQFDPFKLVPSVEDLTHANVFGRRAKPYMGPTNYPAIIEQQGEWVDDYEDFKARSHLRDVSRAPLPVITGKVALSVKEQEDEFDRCNKFAWFCRWHNQPMPGNNEKSLTTVQQGPISLVVGEKIMFSLDQTKAHNKFTEILGNIPNVPIASYEVRGNMVTSLLLEDPCNTNLLEGVITKITETKDKKITVWVRTIKFTDIPDPQFAVELPQKK